MISISTAVTAVVTLIIAGLISGNMLPSSMVHDAVDLRDANPRLVGKLLLGNVAGGVAVSNRLDIRSGELGVSVALTTQHLSLQSGVFHVFGVSAKNQMGWVDTRGIVAAGAIVQKVKPIWDWSVCQLPGESVGKNHLAAGATATASAKAWCCAVNLAVSVTVTGACPEPAAISLVDLFPEALLKASVVQFAAQGDAARGTATFGAARVKLRWPLKNNLAADGTWASDFGRVNSRHDASPQKIRCV